MAKTQPIQWINQYGTGQIYYTGPELSIVTEEGKQLGPGVRCKDFLHDCVWAKLNDKNNFSMYGYKFDFADDMWTDRPRVIVAHPSRSLQADAENMKDFMNQVDSALGMEKPTFYRIPDSLPSHIKKGGALMWIGDPMWMIAPPVFSLWLLLLRNSHLHQAGKSYGTTLDEIIRGAIAPGQHHDGIFLKFARHGLNHMIDKGLANVFNPDLKKNYPPEVSQTTLHHYGGIVSFSDLSAKTAFPDANWDWPAPMGEAAPGIAHA